MTTDQQDDPTGLAEGISFRCCRCTTALSVAKVLAGARLICPYCHTALTIPLTNSVEQFTEEYPLLSPDAVVDSIDQRNVGVLCSGCRTPLCSSVDSPGGKITCPQCGVENAVPRLELVAAKRPIVGHADSSVADGAGQGSAESQETTLAPVICKKCNTRMYAPSEQIGKEIVCPECGTANKVPAPLEPPPRISFQISRWESYGVRHEAPLRSPRRPPDHVTPGLVFGVMHPPGFDPALRHPLPQPPRWPFVTGIVDVLLPLDALSRCLALSILAAASAWLWSWILWSRGAFFPLLFLPAMASTAAWAVGFAAVFLSVVVDTAAGNRKVENWPSGVEYIERSGEVFFVIASILFTYLPASALYWLLREFTPLPDYLRYGMPRDWYQAAWCILLPVLVALQFHPLILLSMLERRSSLNPFSWEVWRTLWTKAGVWLRFQLAVALYASAAIAAFSMAFCIDENGRVLPWLVLVPAGMIYARLLGRLAHCCTGESRQQPNGGDRK